MVVCVCFLALSCGNDKKDAAPLETPSPNAPVKTVEFPIDGSLTPISVDKKTRQTRGISITCPVVSGTRHDTEINGIIDSKVDIFVKELASDADVVDFSIKYNNKGILSMLISGYDSKNSTDTVIRHLALNFNTASGREIEIDSLFDNTAGDWNKSLSEQVNAMAQLNGINLYKDVDDVTRASFYLTENSITLIFALYQIAPYSAGEPAFTLEYISIRAYTSSAGAISVIMNKHE